MQNMQQWHVGPLGAQDYLQPYQPANSTHHPNQNDFP